LKEGHLAFLANARFINILVWVLPRLVVDGNGPPLAVLLPQANLPPTAWSEVISDIEPDYGGHPGEHVWSSRQWSNGRAIEAVPVYRLLGLIVILRQARQIEQLRSQRPME
jgi:hypothetical protein